MRSFGGTMQNTDHVSFGDMCIEGVNIVASMTTRQRCEYLTRISESTAWSADLNTLLQSIVNAIAAALESRNAFLHLYSTEMNCFVKCASCTDIVDGPSYDKSRPLDIGRMRWMLHARRPIVMDYEHPHCCDVIPADAGKFGIKSAVTIPLVAHDNVIGMISVCYRMPTIWDSEGLAYLMSIGRMLGVAFDRISNAKREREMSLLDERKRLGAEIHDGISNLVCALSVSASSVAESYAIGDEEAVKRDIERLESVAWKTTRTLRDEMLSLRMPLEVTDGLISGIEKCLANFEENWGIRVSLTTDLVEPLIVPLTMSLQLTRILNESLSNIIKHAGASSISVTLSKDEHTLSMVIEDNGKGFDVDAVPAERLGLRIMRERAIAAGGTFTVLSSSEGTSICVDIPNWV